MRRRAYQSKRNISLLVIILLVGIGIAYAVLTEQLNINNIVSYDAMKWEVGFSSIIDDGGTIESSGVISNDGKSITVTCDFGHTASQESCIAKATITNNSTFDIGLTNEPIITYDDHYIHTLTFKWNNHPTYAESTVHQNGFIAKGETEEVILTIKTKNLTKDDLPSGKYEIPVTVELNFEEWQKDNLPTPEDLAILPSSGCELEDIYNVGSLTCPTPKYLLNSIRSINFEKGINVPENATILNDITEAQNGTITTFATEAEETNMVDLYIQSEDQIYGGIDMSFWFAQMEYLEEINGLELVDTSMTENMFGIFGTTGINSSTFSLDITSLDTSKVTDMGGMFYGTGSQNPNFTLDVSKMDTSSVTNMFAMFYGAGLYSSTFSLDLSNFNTSNVINMSGMFGFYGASVPNISFELSNFDTSNVEYMEEMFYNFGIYSERIDLNLSNFNTSNVISMYGMFYGMGCNSDYVKINLRGFNTRNVTNMGYMFNGTGENADELILDLSTFDTRNVEYMYNMFENTGYYTTKFELDINHFDTRNVIDFERMLYNTAYNTPNFKTEITIKNPNVNDIDEMLTGVALQPGSKITINYTTETSDLVDQMIATATPGANVVKGRRVG